MKKYPPRKHDKNKRVSMAPRKPENMKAITIVAKEVPAQQVSENTSVETFISQGIANNVPVETMERLLAMRKDLKAEHAKEAFIGAMAKFQADCPTIVKTKEVKTRNGQVAYRYAPIESIVVQVKDALRDNGFSYSTNMEMLDDAVKVYVKVQHIAGHSETTEMSVPLGTKTEIMSRSQVVAAASTFAKRYAFLNAFGILTGDEDNDGADLPDTETRAPAKQAVLDINNPVIVGYRKQLELARSLDELKERWANLPRNAKDVLEGFKDEMKAILTTEAKSA